MNNMDDMVRYVMIERWFICKGVICVPNGHKVNMIYDYGFLDNEEIACVMYLLGCWDYEDGLW